MYGQKVKKKDMCTNDSIFHELLYHKTAHLDESITEVRPSLPFAAYKR
jgi:hypothetical protein